VILVYFVFGFFPFLLVVSEETVDPFGQIFFAFAAQ
jgi:hypothetical protein